MTDSTGEKFGAFISYSRGASGQLAVDLQNGIERFAKPWNKLRAVRVFRDDSSMSANPALWSTIQAGLTESDWLILLATPEAAASEYVNKELTWWVQNKPAGRILLVRAGGDIEWDSAAGDFDQTRATAIPPTLFGAYDEEPRWIDLTWYSEPNSLGTADPRFEAGVADLASTIRAIDKDTLIGENVTQHRKTRRLTRAAIVGLATLLVMSLAAGALALAQKAEATRQRDTAQTQANIATARQLAATAETTAGTDLRTSLQTANYAFQLHPDEPTEQTLYNLAVGTNALPQDGKQAARRNSSRFYGAGEPVTVAAASADGHQLFAGTSQGHVFRWDAKTGKRVEVMRLNGAVEYLSASGDGTKVVASATRGANSGYDTGISDHDVASRENYPVIAMSPNGHILVSVDWREIDAQRKGPTYRAFSLQVIRDGASQMVSPTGGDLSGPVTVTDEGDILMVDRGGGAFTTSTSAVSASATNPPISIRGSDSPLVAAFANNGAFVTGGRGDSLLDVWPMRRELQAGEPRPTSYAQTEDGTPIGGFAISDSGHLVASGSDGRIYLSESASTPEGAGQPRILEGSGRVSFVRFIGEDRLLSAAGNAIELWDLKQYLGEDSKMSAPIPPSHPELRTAGPQTIAVNPAGSKAVVVQDTGDNVLVADLLNRKVRTFDSLAEDENLPFTRTAWLDDDHLLVVSIQAGRVWVLSGPLLETVDATRPISGVPGLERSSWLWGPAAATTNGRVILESSGAVYSLDSLSGRIDEVACGNTQGTPSDTQVQVSLSPDGSQATRLVNLDAGARTQVTVCRTSDATTLLDTTLTGNYLRAAWSDSKTIRLWQSEPNQQSVRAAKVDLSSGSLADGLAEMPVGSDKQAGRSAGSWSQAWNRAAWADSRTGTIELADLNSDATIRLARMPTRGHGFTALGFNAEGTRMVLASEVTNELYAVDSEPQAWSSTVCSRAGGDVTDEDWSRLTGGAPSVRPSCASSLAASGIASSSTMRSQTPTPPSASGSSKVETHASPESQATEKGSERQGGVPNTSGGSATKSQTPATSYEYYSKATTVRGQAVTAYMTVRHRGSEVKFREWTGDALASCFVGKDLGNGRFSGTLRDIAQRTDVQAHPAVYLFENTADGARWGDVQSKFQDIRTGLKSSPPDDIAAELRAKVDACSPDHVAGSDQ